MPPEYEVVVDPSSMISSLAPILVHLVIVAAQCFVAGFFVVHGVALIARPDRASALFDRFGSLRSDVEASPFGGRRGGESGARIGGALQVILGIAILSPVVLRWSGWSSAVALVLGIGLLIRYGRDAAASGRAMRRLAVTAAVLTLAFMAWERDDPATQAARILFKANEWRAHELDWQLANDVESPKVGDLAPDFELQDPTGERSIRLSTFFGKRPVALVFGSYT